MNLLISLLINALAIFITASILPGVHLANFWTAIVVTIIMGIINVLVKPIVLLLTLPINVITLGLFTFFVNGLMILLVQALVQGFSVDNLVWAIVFSIVISIVNGILQSLTK